MVLGHAAVASLAGQTALRRDNLLFLIVAAYGPDWMDKPLKLLFGFSGHGLAHSLLGSAAILLLVFAACRALRLPDRIPAVIAALWGLHLLCDMVHIETLLWPALGPFPTVPESTAELAWRFYFGGCLVPLAWCDLALTALALALRAGGLMRRFLPRPVFSVYPK